MERQSGILAPIFCLPSRYGIGGFGKEGYEFVDFLRKSKQKIWQILPLVQTGYGDSPYSSVCSYSFNPYFISPEKLYEKGLIKKSDLKRARWKSKTVDYGRLYNTRFELLRTAFGSFDVANPEFIKFTGDKKFHDFALYMALKTANDNAPFYTWEKGLKYRDKTALKKFEKQNELEVKFWQFVQYEAKTEWEELKAYANANGVSIMGDMPLYVSHDSVDVWVNPQLFDLDDDLYPKSVAGVPPDYFSRTGQLWGNPVYNYERHQKDGFKWWIDRVKTALSNFDYVRIDHFRGLDRFYKIPAHHTDATQGEWVKVPSEELFASLHKSVDKSRIVAEDLGIIDDGVRELLKSTGYPGMRILSFAFNGESDNLYLPENLVENCVCYTGTHDNDTLLGLIENSDAWDLGNLYRGVENSLRLLKIKRKLTDNKKLARAIIKLGFSGKAKLMIMPLQDLSLLGSEYRINAPGTFNNYNWTVRFPKRATNDACAKRLLKLTESSGR